MILVTGCRMFRRTVKTKLEYAVVFIFFLLAILKVNPALLILAAIPFGWCYVWWQTRRLSHAERNAASVQAPAETPENGGDGK